MLFVYQYYVSVISQLTLVKVFFFNINNVI